MYKKKGYLVADAAAVFQYIWFNFQLHLFSTSAARERGSGHLMGGSSRQGAKINYRRFNLYALSISHSPPPLNNEPNAEWLHVQRKGQEGKVRKHVPAQSRFLWDGRRLTRLSLTYRRCSARRGMAWEMTVHHPEYNQRSTWLGS